MKKVKQTEVVLITLVNLGIKEVKWPVQPNQVGNCPELRLSRRPRDEGVDRAF